MNAEQLASQAGNFVLAVANRFINNCRSLWASFVAMRPENFIRMVAIVGAYLLLRPYLIKIGARIQEKQHEEAFHSTLAPKISPNALRGGGGKVLGEVEESEEEGEGTGAENWGKKARKRQRQLVKKRLEKEARVLKEGDESSSDEDVSDLLT